MTAPSDEDFLDAYSCGDFAAFDSFYKRHAALLHQFLRVRLRSANDADDALQDVFTRLHRNIHAYDRTLGGLGWVVTIARNVAIDQLRRRKPVAAVEPDELPSPFSHGEQVAARQELTRLLARLSADERGLIERRLLDDEAYESLAPDHGGTPSAARQKLSRLLRKLRAP